MTAGSLIGVAEVYDGAAQLYPQSAADVADFKVDASTPVITEVDPAVADLGCRGDGNQECRGYGRQPRVERPDGR